MNKCNIHHDIMAVAFRFICTPLIVVKLKNGNNKKNWNNFDVIFVTRSYGCFMNICTPRNAATWKSILSPAYLHGCFIIYLHTAFCLNDFVVALLLVCMPRALFLRRIYESISSPYLCHHCGTAKITISGKYFRLSLFNFLTMLYSERSPWHPIIQARLKNEYTSERWSKTYVFTLTDDLWEKNWQFIVLAQLKGNL